MKKCVLLSILVCPYLSATDKISQLKAAIVRSDADKVAQLVQQGSFDSEELAELRGWADDTIEERRIGAITTGELYITLTACAGFGTLVVSGLIYMQGDEPFRAGLKKIGLTTNFRAAIAALGVSALCYYGIQSGSRGSRKRLRDALTIKKLLE